MNGEIKKILEKKITDIGFVAYLTCEDSVNNFPALRIKRKERERNRNRSIFIFDETLEFEAKSMKYFNHEAKVDPLQFHETLRNLKSYARQG